jgi:PKD repeat protein
VPLSGISPLTVSFTDQSTGSPNNWAWDFTNNGTFDNDAQNPTYTYENPGLYSVTLVASNAYGSGYNTKIDYIEVFPPPPPPVVDFVGSPLSGDAPLTVDFTDQSSGSPNAWGWDFTNTGSIDSTQQNPTYTYTSPGLYTVKLNATNLYGTGTLTKVDYISVTAPPAPVSVQSVSSPSVVKGNVMEHTVTLTAPTELVQTFSFSLVGGTATSADFTNTPYFSQYVELNPSGTTITVPIGVSSFTVSYQTSNTTEYEGDRTVLLTVDGITGVGTIISHYVLIDFEAPPLRSNADGYYPQVNFITTPPPKEGEVVNNTISLPPSPYGTQWYRSGTTFTMIINNPEILNYRKMRMAYNGAIDISINYANGDLVTFSADNTNPAWKQSLWLGNVSSLSYITSIVVTRGATSFGRCTLDNVQFST